MNTEVVFVGDVHGNLSALRGLWHALDMRGRSHAVFLGDYINKGAHSAEVIQELLAYSQAGRATLLAGNHETALLEALDTGDLSAFLKMGGAMTIRSYVGRRVAPEVLESFRASFPTEHLEAIRRMPDTYESDDLIAQHVLPAASTPKFRIGAHVPVGKLPRIEHHSAQLDTGCGGKSGRLTALFWPSLDYVQVDARGIVVLH
ncbi:serine/threonine protein phosphatase [Amycolatopsis sp. K13G38]|uniref:Serine/threonine protein phosphatase n=1 Tax=Amycolatopsis acididurans TaxID=2724524 RepID=A0ABX1J0Z4_9PSEU|nr:metallophosphoesterase [Amycolatopsis acididurans]NKQ52015.1 serine/threonine protein phosphatase [Amycolatopsis acididurans]